MADFVLVPNARGLPVMVDAEDAERVLALKWSVYFDGDVIRCLHSSGHHLTRRKIYLHRFILDAAKGQIVDHINGDPLDNRRANLRFATSLQNCRNSRTVGGKSAFKGVFRSSTKQERWVACIRVMKRKSYLGTFDTQEAAAAAYDRAARQHFGEFAALNFPRDGEQSCLRVLPHSQAGGDQTTSETFARSGRNLVATHSDQPPHDDGDNRAGQ